MDITLIEFQSCMVLTDGVQYGPNKLREKIADTITKNKKSL